MSVSNDDAFYPVVKKAKIEDYEFGKVVADETEIVSMEEKKTDFNTLEENISLFKSSINKTPRKVQEEVLEFVHKNIKNKSLFVLDLPTGSGKSAVGGFAGILSCTHYESSRIVYVTSSKNLQKQVAQDALKWTYEKSGKVVCQFGKSNYYCPMRIKNLLSKKQDDPKGLCVLCDKSEKLTRNVMVYLKELSERNIKYLTLLDDFYTIPFREIFLDKLKNYYVPDHCATNIWNEISSSGGCEKTKCNCRKELRFKFNSEKDGDLNSFLAKNLQCPSCKVRVCAKMCGILVTNMDAIFSYASHAGLEYIINPTDVIIFDEAHNICKRSQELFETNCPRLFNAKKIDETLQKWSSMGLSLCTGHLDHKVFFNFPEDDRAVLCFDNKNYMQYYSMVRENLNGINTNAVFKNELRLKIRNSFEKIVDIYKEEEEKFEKSYNLVELKLKIINLCQLLKLPIETESSIIEQTCTERQTVLGESSKDDITNNRNKAIYSLQAEIVDYFVNFQNSDIIEKEYKLQVHNIYIKGEQTIEHFWNTLTEVHTVISDIELSKKAIEKCKWTNDYNSYSKFIPKISKSGFQYELTFMEKSNILKTCIWDKLKQGAMFMSATISHPEKEGEFCFEDFFCELGLPETTECYTTCEVFNSERLTIYVPPMKRYAYNTSTEYKREYHQERVKHLTKQITANPLATLVLSNNIEDYKSVIYNLKKTLKSHKHVDYNRDKGLFEMFENGVANNFIIYGSEKLWTGLNLPGRIGLVVIMKPFNKFRQIEEPYYTTIFRNYYNETKKNTIEMFNSLYRYNTCKDTIQASGRIMRKEDDYGMVMFLSDNKKDAHMLRNKYKNSNFICGSELNKWHIPL